MRREGLTQSAPMNTWLVHRTKSSAICELIIRLCLLYTSASILAYTHNIQNHAAHMIPSITNICPTARPSSRPRSRPRGRPARPPQMVTSPIVLIGTAFAFPPWVPLARQGSTKLGDVGSSARSKAWRLGGRQRFTSPVCLKSVRPPAAQAPIRSPGVDLFARPHLNGQSKGQHIESLASKATSLCGKPA